MSTFNGVVKEFSEIRIDFFRINPAHPPPLACFLSHVHTDHLQGLESLRSPFIYCSSATRELLLRLEKYPHRMNFSKGVLETRLVTYKHLRSVLRPVPLGTPTTIELRPGREIRVTLLDANHCPGAVMFLIEGQGKAILYTGDIRSEPWWVNSITRQPCMVAYATGLRKLDTIYLDTTFATKRNPYREFPSKQDGLRELLAAVDRYPAETVFHFNSWTFGYEEAWIALSALLQTRMHIDDYKMRLFRALSSPRDGQAIPDPAALCGFKLGNAWHNGCLTSSTDVRLHGCETGHGCNVRNHPDTIRIVPIVSRLPNGEELAELGAGGGHGDLAQWHELDLSDQNAAVKLLSLCASIDDPDERKQAIDLVMSGMQSHGRKLSLPDSDALDTDDNVSLDTLAAILARSKAGQRSSKAPRPPLKNRSASNAELPKEIHFPYSRHSSYTELRHLVETFRPQDLYPCTVDEANWDPSLSMQNLFGDLCSAEIFAHDKDMLERYAFRLEQGDLAHEPDDNHDTHSSQSPPPPPPSSQSTSSGTASSRQPNTNPTQAAHQSAAQSQHIPQPSHTSARSRKRARLSAAHLTPHRPSERPTGHEPAADDARSQDSECSLPDSAFDSQLSSVSVSVSDDATRSRRVARRKEAYRAASGKGGVAWHEYSTITPVGDEELG